MSTNKIAEEIHPDEDTSLRIKKTDIEQSIWDKEHYGWVQFVPVDHNKKKIYRITTDQYESLKANLETIKTIKIITANQTNTKQNG